MLDVHLSLPGKIIAGLRRPGLRVAQAIERATGRPRADGAVWPGGPIRTEEWLRPGVALDVHRARSRVGQAAP